MAGVPYRRITGCCSIFFLSLMGMGNSASAGMRIQNAVFHVTNLSQYPTSSLWWEWSGDCENNSPMTCGSNALTSKWLDSETAVISGTIDSDIIPFGDRFRIDANAFANSPDFGASDGADMDANLCNENRTELLFLNSTSHTFGFKLRDGSNAADWIKKNTPDGLIEVDWPEAKIESNGKGTFWFTEVNGVDQDSNFTATFPPSSILSALDKPIDLKKPIMVRIIFNVFYFRGDQKVKLASINRLVPYSHDLFSALGNSIIIDPPQ